MDDGLHDAGRLDWRGVHRRQRGTSNPFARTAAYGGDDMKRIARQLALPHGQSRLPDAAGSLPQCVGQKPSAQRGRRGLA